MAFDSTRIDRHDLARLGAVAAVAVLIVGGFYFAAFSGSPTKPAAQAATEPVAKRNPINAFEPQTVDVTGQEQATVKVEQVSERVFTVERDAIGNIDFDQDATLPVFTPYPGRIVQLFAKAGDDVKKGQVLFDIASPDLVNAESTLISAASTRVLNDKALARAKELYASQAIAEKDYEAAVNAFEIADGSYRAARDAVRIFGKSDAQMDEIIAARHVDGTMPVSSPLDGRVTARNAAIGLYVQPGNAPAPFTVSNIDKMWMLASVPETDIPLLHLGEDVDVKVMAYPGRIFKGHVVNVGASVDPNTHRILVRSEVPDPNHELRAQMFATFVIRTGDAMRSPAIPEGGVVREGDGTMTAWVTTDGEHFTRRTIKIGMQQDGYDQVLDGLKPGDRVATDGALFLDNALTTASG
jgi:cobalt-zinc-cadmium efflux system membrane fusion protein